MSTGFYAPILLTLTLQGTILKAPNITFDSAVTANAQFNATTLWNVDNANFGPNAAKQVKVMSTTYNIATGKVTTFVAAN